MVDEEGNILGFSILAVSRLSQSKPLVAELVQTLLKIDDRAAQKAKYRGEIFSSDQPVDENIMSIDFFQRDREQNPHNCYRFKEMGTMIKNDRQYRIGKD